MADLQAYLVITLLTRAAVSVSGTPPALSTTTGDTVNIPCLFGEGTLRYILWYYNDRTGPQKILILAKGVLTIAAEYANRASMQNDNSTLILKEITAADEGTYHCVVNRHGQTAVSQFETRLIVFCFRPDMLPLSAPTWTVNTAILVEALIIPLANALYAVISLAIISIAAIITLSLLISKARDFVGKMVYCTPCILVPPVKRGLDHEVILFIYENQLDLIKKKKTIMPWHMELSPPHRMNVWRFGDINIELFDRQEENREKIDEQRLSVRDINIGGINQLWFTVKPLESGASRKLLKFKLSQKKFPSYPTVIHFTLPSDGFTAQSTSDEEFSSPTHRSGFTAQSTSDEEFSSPTHRSGFTAQSTSDEEFSSPTHRSGFTAQSTSDEEFSSPTHRSGFTAQSTFDEDFSSPRLRSGFTAESILDEELSSFRRNILRRNRYRSGFTTEYLLDEELYSLRREILRRKRHRSGFTAESILDEELSSFRRKILRRNRFRSGYIEESLLDEELSSLRREILRRNRHRSAGASAKPIERSTESSSKHEKDGKTVHWDFLTECPQELTLQDNEVVISCGIRFSPSGTSLSTPIKVTLDHNAHFTYPGCAEIVFYTRNKDSTTFVRIPSSTKGCPRCEVRSKDLDLYVDHFSDWWIVAVIYRYFVGKRVECTPYVLPPVTKGLTHFVLLCIYDDLLDVIKKTNEKMKKHRELFPPQQMFVHWRAGDINIELFEGPNENEVKIGEMIIGKTDMNLVQRKQFPFEVKPLESGESQKILKFTLDQKESPSYPTPIKFNLMYDGMTATTALTTPTTTTTVEAMAVAGAASLLTHARSQAAGMSTQSGKNRIVTDKELRKLAGCLPADSITDVAIYLGLEYTDYDNIKLQNQSSLKDANFKMLMKWKCRDDGGNVRDLDEALNEANCGGIVYKDV